jgi:hypothetical protein
VVPASQQQLVAGSVHVPLQQPFPQAVKPAAQPHFPLDASRHAMPAEQHLGPHGVVPDGQAASARNGFNSTAPTVAPTLMPMALRAVRLLRGVAIARAKSSNPRSVTLVLPAVTRPFLLSVADQGKGLG